MWVHALSGGTSSLPGAGYISGAGFSPTRVLWLSGVHALGTNSPPGSSAGPHVSLSTGTSACHSRLVHIFHSPRWAASHTALPLALKVLSSTQNSVPTANTARVAPTAVRSSASLIFPSRSGDSPDLCCPRARPDAPLRRSSSCIKKLDHIIIAMWGWAQVQKRLS